MRASIVCGVVLGLAAVFPVVAQGKPSFRSLVADGYEIKAVSHIDMDMLPVMGFEADTLPQLLVTLQNGVNVAVCQFSISNWSLLTASSIDGDTQCDVMRGDETPAATNSQVEQPSSPGRTIERR